MMNNYTFRSWHNGAGAWYEFTVHAEHLGEAEAKARNVTHSKPGLDSEFTLIACSVPVPWRCIAILAQGHEVEITQMAFTRDEAELAAEIYLSEHRYDVDWLFTDVEIEDLEF
jgi:hypothetical protein